MLRRPIVLAVPLCAGLAFAGGPAQGLPLDDGTCKQLLAEMKTLEGQGVGSDLAAGLDWALANLPNDRLETVRHYIALKEDVLFRCPSLHPPVAPDPEAGDQIYGPPLPPEMIAKIKAQDEARKKKAAAKAAKAAALKKAKAEKAKKKKDAAAAAAGARTTPAPGTGEGTTSTAPLTETAPAPNDTAGAAAN